MAYAYIARKECGCIVAATMDSAAHRVEVARDVAAWIRKGLTIERVESDQVQELWGPKCTHEPTQQGLYTISKD